VKIIIFFEIKPQMGTRSHRNTSSEPLTTCRSVDNQYWLRLL